MTVETLVLGYEAFVNTDTVLNTTLWPWQNFQSILTPLCVPSGYQTTVRSTELTLKTAGIHHTIILLYTLFPE